MLPSIGMEPQDELQQLLARQAALKQELTEKKKRSGKPNAASATPSPVRSAAPRRAISAADRKRRTRRLILIVSYIDSVSQAVSMTRLMKGLDAFPERDQDRALFDLPPKVANPQVGGP